MAKKAKKRTTAQRRAAAKLAWKARKLASANTPSAITVEQFTAPFGFGVPGYDALGVELTAAFDQSSKGKGKERHANGRPFDRQPIMEMGRLFGPGFASGQATKKMQEAQGMLARGDRDAALAEVHGAIVYAAAMASLIREMPAPAKPAAKRR